MKMISIRSLLILVLGLGGSTLLLAADVTKATIDGTGPGWQTLTEADFAHVNCDSNHVS